MPELQLKDNERWVQIYGDKHYSYREIVAVKVGSRIYPDGWEGRSMNLVDYDYGSYDALCDMRETRLALPSATMTDVVSPIIVKITGRKAKRQYGDMVVRVKLTWVKPDREESTDYGFMTIE
jgi:hypothetical protein